MRPRRRLLPAFLLALSALASASRAQDDGGSIGGDALSGTLRRARDTGALVIGYRESSFPFSYAVPGSSSTATAAEPPRGYAIDLCLGIVAEVGRALGQPIRPEYALITSETRLDAVASGRVDLECGSTTSNIEREKLVAFSPITFVAGTKLMVRRDSGIRSYRDLGAGKTVVVTTGTTNEAVVRKLIERNHLGARVVTGRDHGESYAMVADGRADAFATDDVLLSGLIAQHRDADKFMVVGDFLSYEPYGIVYRRGDPAMAEIVDRAFARMAQDRDLLEYYHRWFERRTPGGEELNLPMSAQLVEVFRVLGVED